VENTLRTFTFKDFPELFAFLEGADLSRGWKSNPQFCDLSIELSRITAAHFARRRMNVDEITTAFHQIFEATIALGIVTTPVQQEMWREWMTDLAIRIPHLFTNELLREEILELRLELNHRTSHTFDESQG
jgi:hypothetical protein